MIGGKLASYRLFSQELCDHVAPADFGVSTACSTHTRALPGGNTVPDGDRALRPGLQGDSRSRRATSSLPPRRARAPRARARREAAERTRRHVRPCEPVLEAECAGTVREEMARTVGDVARRTRPGLAACGGMAMRGAPRTDRRPGARLVTARTASSRRRARGLSSGSRSAQVVAMGTEQARQEALSKAHM